MGVTEPMKMKHPYTQLRLFGTPQEVLTSDDYYTPTHVFEGLGLEFDLDVCAPPGGSPHVPARRHFTQEDDGLAQPWEGLVWMNPPWSNTAPWAQKFMEHRNGVALVPHSKSVWHIRLFRDAEAVAVPDRYFDFVGGSIFLPFWFAAYGQPAVEALSNWLPTR